MDIFIVFFLASSLYSDQNWSTLLAISSITDKIQTPIAGIENGNYSCGIFLDLSKAFDTVSHTVYFKNLRCMS